MGRGPPRGVVALVEAADGGPGGGLQPVGQPAAEAGGPALGGPALPEAGGGAAGQRPGVQLHRRRHLRHEAAREELRARCGRGHAGRGRMDGRGLYGHFGQYAV